MAAPAWRARLSMAVVKGLARLHRLGIIRMRVHHFRLPLSIMYGRRATDNECKALNEALAQAARAGYPWGVPRKEDRDDG